MLDSHEKQFHIPLSFGEVGEYCILPGDPGRCEKIAAFLDNPHHVIQNREYNVWNGTFKGKTVTVCSTGIGGPSSAIAMEELFAVGADTFIRVGTAGGINLKVHGGDVVIATAAVRQEGTAREYAPLEYPAAASFDVTQALVWAAEEMGSRFHTGVVQSKDSFYGQHSPDRMPIEGELKARWEAWKRLGVLCSEMESATQFVVADSLGARAGAVFHIVWNQERKNEGLDDVSEQNEDTDLAIRTAIEALKILIEKDRA